MFDAYGTLLDVHSVVLRAGAQMQGDARALSQLWRQKQLEFTWLLALMDRYRDFGQITEAALRTALAQLQWDASEAQIQQLLDAYLAPAVFPDARTALAGLSDFPRAILSNGSPKMLQAAV
ncbi:MAG TPA: HAD-IA family hydrolase, partial [Bryobacteraceae bacterium]|nr:HAD-IA family hydrolase [Bryobacteraceae bacterium]